MRVIYQQPSAFADQDHSATLLLQDTSVFDNDEGMQPHVKSGRAQLVRGDTLVLGDVRYVWGKATDYGRVVDYVVFTTGKSSSTRDVQVTLLTTSSFVGAALGKPAFDPFRGFTTNPPNLLTKAILNVLCTIPNSVPQPKFIAATSIIVADSMIAKAKPFLRPIFGLPIQSLNTVRKLHMDWLGIERVLAHGSGRPWGDEEPQAKVTTVDRIKWQDRKGLPSPGSLEILVLRPKSIIERWVQVERPNEATHTISREEVAHFITETAMKNWNLCKDIAVVVRY